jgi:hypothetical protein
MAACSEAGILRFRDKEPALDIMGDLFVSPVVRIRMYGSKVERLGVVK